MNLAPIQKLTEEKIGSKSVFKMTHQLYHDPASTNSATPSTAYGTADTPKTATTHTYFVTLYYFSGGDETFLFFSVGKKIRLAVQSNNLACKWIQKDR